MTGRQLKKVIEAARDRFVLDLQGAHGIRHWNRVRENGLEVAKRSGADTDIVEIFAYLHDCCRENEGADPEHGQRAAEFAQTLRGNVLNLDDDEFALLCEACMCHTKGRGSDHVTVLTCWDADRLDLGRVGIRPNPQLLFTDFARRKATIKRAYARSRA